MDITRFAELGYAIIPDVISSRTCDELIQKVSQLPLAGAGSRNLLTLSWCGQLANVLKAHAATVALLPVDAVAAQCTLFDKSAEKNWAVAIHQDLSIPVRERVAAAECAGWARKEGVLHTQPPPDVLAKLVAVRIHLDSCPPGAGPLRVVPGSHRHGRLSESEVEHQRTHHGEVECTVMRGAALVMRPLLLHASSRVAGNSARRVLHFLFGPRSLPYGLDWPAPV
jgi:ectoine hydroxylase-related dioxygenase (phytanoyl-CoA dioxygenase family)